MLPISSMCRLSTERRVSMAVTATSKSTRTAMTTNTDRQPPRERRAMAPARTPSTREPEVDERILDRWREQGHHQEEGSVARAPDEPRSGEKRGEVTRAGGPDLIR